MKNLLRLNKSLVLIDLVLKKSNDEMIWIHSFLCIFCVFLLVDGKQGILLRVRNGRSGI